MGAYYLSVKALNYITPFVESAYIYLLVDMSRRIDAVKAEYTKSAEPLQKRVKQLETDVQELSLIHI